MIDLPTRLKQFATSLRVWLIVGIGIKRWLVLVALGTLILGAGFLYLVVELVQMGIVPRQLYDLIALEALPDLMRVAVFLSVGFLLLVIALTQLGRSLVEPFQRPGETVGETLIRYRQRNRGPRIVAIGGGTGMPSLLRGLKAHTSNITAIVTVADDGGSSGRLRREFGLLPPGDFRNNIAALARDESLITQLIQYRFGESVSAENDPSAKPSDLKGHSVGNLLIAALVGITGSFDEALLNIDRVLAMRGKVMPSTLQTVQLTADIAVGDRIMRVEGESAIPKAQGRIQQAYLEPARIRAYPPAVRAILQADMVVMGPGSLYTSVLPNLLVPDLARALAATKAVKVYVCNVAEQPGETDGYAVSTHLAAIEQHTQRGLLDYVLANNRLDIDPAKGGGATKFVVLDELDGDTRLVAVDLVDAERPWRHDSSKVAEQVIALLADRRRR